jgi:hypothetical protein
MIAILKKYKVGDDGMQDTFVLFANSTRNEDSNPHCIHLNFFFHYFTLLFEDSKHANYDFAGMIIKKQKATFKEEISFVNTMGNCSRG